MGPARTDLAAVLTTTRTNATLSWLLLGFVVATAVGNSFFGDPLWAGFALVVACVLALPPIALATRRAMIPWEVALVATLPVFAHSLPIHPLIGQLTTYLSVAALALVVAVELHLFTPIQMSVGFAIVFVVVATLAAAGFWAIARWSSDVLLGTTLVLDPAQTTLEQERELMVEFVASALAGLLAGLLFEFYVRRNVRPGKRLP
ncbi:hypothetical protein [Halapricum salinum]|uniref:Uncharacterized protein n=1 Tax=Halapricum salinum TaxID=1457250 RepID=A0A4D6HH37_9EURY|nr:hypothetical protein [Halapricum salinum]QCC52556.1 hypothetical protein DV733_15555 [Halapricum salinum]